MGWDGQATSFAGLSRVAHMRSPASCEDGGIPRKKCEYHRKGVWACMCCTGSVELKLQGYGAVY